MMNKTRLQTATGFRPGTAMTTNSAAIVPARTVDIHSKPRPITAQGGIDSVIPISSGPPSRSRHVQDLNYIISLLQSKESAIETEMKKIQQQLEKLDEDNATLPALKEAHRVVLQDVTALELYLSDLSLAIENTRRRSDPTEIHIRTRQFQIENETLANEADEIFKQRQKRHREIEDIERNIDDKHNYLHHFFESADVSKRKIFHEMILQKKESENEKKQLERVMDALVEKKKCLMAEVLHVDGHGKEYNEVCLEVETVRSEINRMDDELRLLEMDAGDAQLVLEKRIHTNITRISELICDERIIEENSKSLATRKQELVKRQQDLSQEKGKPLSLADQYTELFRADSINSQKLQDAQSEIVQLSNDLVSLKTQTIKLLNDLSVMIAKSKRAVPSQNEMRKCKDTLVFKQKNLEKTQETIERLNYEKEKRLLEVKKTEQLEERIQEELRSLTTKIGELNEGIVLYDDLQSLQENADLTHDYLMQMKERYQRRFDFLNTCVIQMETELIKAENELRGKDVWMNLRHLENTLQNSGEVVNSLQQFIHVKSQETDYTLVKKDCLLMVRSLASQK